MAGGTGGSGLKRSPRYAVTVVTVVAITTATAALLLSPGASADDPAESPRPMDDAEKVAALMEFVGGWERSDDEWIDVMNLDPEHLSAELRSTDTEEHDYDDNTH